jgi:ubiquitin C-terminal hydrolase
MTLAQLIANVTGYFTKVENALSSAGVGKYQEGTIAFGGNTTVDLPTLLGFVPANYNIFSVSVDFKMDDPESAANPKPVIPAWAVLDYSISTAGVMTIYNRHPSAAIKYYARFNTPVKK